MSSLKDQLSSLVYSTDKGQLCPGCEEPVNSCKCSELNDQKRLQALDGIVRIRKETSGRKGKGVTTITGIPLPENELKALAKKLKKTCGTGGALKDGVVEIQGDQREKLKLMLEKEGYTVKLAGG
ncbi:MAG: translation initiation factor Sui1 [Neptuniibacter sp.]